MPPDTNIPTPRTDTEIFHCEDNRGRFAGHVDANFARIIERENIQLREELEQTENQVQLEISFRETVRKENEWLRKDLTEIASYFGVGHPDRTEAKLRLQQKAQLLSTFKQLCGELLSLARPSHTFMHTNRQDWCSDCQTITRADALMKGEK